MSARFDWDEIDRALAEQVDLELQVDRDWTERCAAEVAAGRLTADGNRMSGDPRPAEPSELEALEALSESELREIERLGERVLGEGRAAAVVLNGGMATRFGGVVKGVVPAIGKRSFLELKLSQALGAGAAAFLTMNSFATHRATCELLGQLCSKPHASPAPGSSEFGERVRSFVQSVALRLDERGGPFRDRSGALSFYAPGHGEFVRALRRAGELDRLLASGVEYIMLSNVDNLGADFVARIIGYHCARGRAITCEVARALAGDKGGSPCWVDGRLQIVEGFRYPAGFDFDRLHFLATNTFVFSLRELRKAEPLRNYYVEKQVDGRTAVQIESVVNELTLQLSTAFLAVPRGGPQGRFFPVKTPEDLDLIRGDSDLAERFSS